MTNTEKGKEGEFFITELAMNAYLDYWCYPNPKDEYGDKKEICDLLILFKKTCIICEVKNYEFKGNYERYFRKTVDAGATQIDGAERKLFKLNRDVYIKHPYKGISKFEKEKYSNVIRIVIHLGEGLIFQHLGRLTKNGMFVHIFGKEDFKHLLTELLTIADLSDFLLTRECLATKVNIAIYGKDKDLLGLYFLIKPHLKHYIEEKSGQNLLLDLENGWEEYLKIKEKDSKFENDLKHVEGLIYDWAKRDLLLNEITKPVAEELMSLDRNSRRKFSVAFLEFLDKYLNKGHRRIIRRNIVVCGIGIIFFYYSKEFDGENLPLLMMIAAEGFAYYTNYEVTNIILLGIPEKENIKLMHMDCSNLKNSDPEVLKKALKELGWFEEQNLIKFNIDLHSAS